MRNANAVTNSTDHVPDALGVAEHGLEHREVEGEEDVLDHDDAEDEPGLGVGEASELDQELGDDRRRRDADGPGDDERLAVAPAEREAEARCRRRR